MRTLYELQTEVGEWGIETFPDSTLESITAHLVEEVYELSDEAGFDDRTASKIQNEAADCLLLLLHVAHREGFDLLTAAAQKFEVNKNRDWSVQAPGGYTKHREPGQVGTEVPITWKAE